MSLGWSAVLDVLLRIVEQSPEHGGIERLCVIRDLNGRVRLACRPSAMTGVPLDGAALERQISAGLGAWFAGPILFTTASPIEERRLAQSLINRFQRWPAEWPLDWDNGLGRRSPISPGMWSGHQQLRSKNAWLRQDPVQPEWPLGIRTPAIVSFYSFKGGVGRTTLLGLSARLLARNGQRVAVLDLDLEAPGLGRFFGVETERGILDLLAEHTATGTIDVADLAQHCRTLDEGDGQIVVFPVGPMDTSYIERLGCLDFAPRSGDRASSVEGTLRRVLALVKERYQPNYIFLDARAGLHDLGGLSVHALAHVDVLVGRAGTATLDGFALALRTLAQRRRREDLRLVVAQSFVPLPIDETEGRRIRADWTVRLYDHFCSTVYTKLYADAEDDLPGATDETAMHYPWPIPRYDSLTHVDRIDEIDATVADAHPFADIRDRIVELCGRAPAGTAAVDESEEID